jgi:hypothetical protein
MKLLAVSLARLTALTDLNEWNPQGKVPLREFLHAFVERYGFLKFPTIEEYDTEKGASFQYGIRGAVEFHVTLFSKGIVIDTRSSTEDAERLLQDAQEWAEQFFGIEHAPHRISRKLFLSEISFSSDVPLTFLNPKLHALATRLGEVVSSSLREPQTFDLFSVSFSADPPTRLGALSLRIERLQGEPFWEQKYFSSAPLPTNEHLAFLAEFESLLKESSPSKVSGSRSRPQSKRKSSRNPH